MTIIVVTLLVFSLFALIGFCWEKRDYNNGKCPRCWGKLNHFDTDSQGGRGYVCENRDYYTWVSYPFIEVK